MCGRYTLTCPRTGLLRRFDVEPGEDFDWEPRYNIAPTQLVPVIVEEEGRRQLRLMRWGLIPRWARDPSIGNRLINARSETVRMKPAFREAFRKRRCLIPADGFYEWKKTGSRKQPYRIVTPSRELFAFGGLWERWRNENGEPVESFTIITVDANAAVAGIHDRMPLILARESERLWLDASVQQPELVEKLMRPPPARETLAYPVSIAVNTPANDRPEVVEEAPAEAADNEDAAQLQPDLFGAPPARAAKPAKPRPRRSRERQRR